VSESPEGMISVDEFAKLKGLKAAKVIEMIRDGFYVGRKVGEDWHVNASDSAVSAKKASKATDSALVRGSGVSNEVVVTDIQMSFASMVIFMVKWVVASIPAFIILFIIFLVVTAVLGGAMVGFSGSRY